jgi:GSH-dependent disulfide-bond oxidoreductase
VGRDAELSFELIGARTENCVRSAIAFDEAGLPYRAVKLNLRAGEQRSERHLSLNATGKVPVLVGSRKGEEVLVLSQSVAILMYAARAGRPELLPEVTSIESARVLERFLYVVTDVVAPSHAGSFARWCGDEQMGVLHLRRSLAAFAFCEQFVERTPFLAGEGITLADIAAVTYAKFNEPFIDWTDLPNLTSWFRHMSSRAAVQRGLTVFD